MQDFLPKGPVPPCHGIIPARFGSTRFPGKVLADILGKPMFWHVWSRACRCGELASVTLATDDGRVAEAAEKLKVPCVLTSAEHPSGTDRVFEAALALKLPADSVIVNIQGDEPCLMPHMLSDLVSPFAGSAVRVSTLARKMRADEAAQPDKVKVVCSRSGRALYFSRAPIPFARDYPGGLAQNGADKVVFLAHIGLYAFRFEALRVFTGLPPSRLELTEKLEQLRLLENDIPVQVVQTQGRSLGVDRPDDLAEVIRVLERVDENI
ncbi:MAG: 3-deoxy-manno-octulosonate cytidylyltransferase [Deltaproteobacteria bacterium]|jgi:3-deoxy-manno-octulosonate cytidylyltransferase (CMP-KDO synthetase)|nr:3-deoxy-manno-octulosonate cytidylyltransferase [Deltaproteobacteria bacterium]